MKYKYIKFNIVYFLILYILLCGIVFYTSNKFFLNDFLAIEKEQNKNSIETFLNVINKNIESLTNSTNDYANWDDTYEFMKNKNKKYIYANFREGSHTLAEINLDSIMYVNTKDKIVYSQYDNEYLNANKKEFESFLIEKFKSVNNINTIINFNSKFVYVFKSQVKMSDKTGENVGYIVTSKLLNAEALSKRYAIFESVKIGNVLDNKFDFDIKLNYLDTKVTLFMDDNYLVNNIQFFDEKNEYIISLSATSQRNLIKNSKKTMVIFNLIVFVIMFFIFFFIYKNQSLINNQNELLNKRVERRTKRLRYAYKKISEKNKELYTLANMDSLTKIRNRRKYFIESKALLEKAITNNQNFDIAIIDIDNFKKINDKFGHSVGDEVLITFCDIVNGLIDKNIPFGRIGGEEFCITFYDKKEDEVNEICENIRKKCEKYNLNIDGGFLTFTISLGLSSKNNSNETIDKILQRADALLYEAKNSGKNRLIRRVE